MKLREESVAMAQQDDKQKAYLMVDFETLSTQKDALLLSGGFVVFTENEILSEDYQQYTVLDQIYDNKHVDQETVEWWHKQSSGELANLLYSGELEAATSIPNVLEDIQRAYDVESIWSRGAMDWDILSEYVELPYWLHKDCRTLDLLMPMSQTNNHNALADALNQVSHVQEVLKRWDST